MTPRSPRACSSPRSPTWWAFSLFSASPRFGCARAARAGSRPPDVRQSKAQQPKAMEARGMQIAVRRLEAKDKAVWRKLFKGYIEFYQASLTEDVIEETWRRLMAGGEDFHI